MYVEFCPSVKLEIRPARGAGFFLPLLQAPSFPNLTPRFPPCALQVLPVWRGGLGDWGGGSSAQQRLPFPPCSELLLGLPFGDTVFIAPSVWTIRYNWISSFSLSEAGFSCHCCTRQKRKREEIDATISKRRVFFFFLMFWCGFPWRPLLQPPSWWWWPRPASLLPLLHLWLLCGFLTCGLSWGCPVRLFSEGRGWFVT